MKHILTVLVAVVSLAALTRADWALSTPSLVKEAGYPLETHTVQSADGFILTVFRIPYSPYTKNQGNTNKSVAFLQHGLLSSSDCYLLNFQDALPFQLADAGFDVWLGNVRGNRYSKKHVSLSTASPHYWDFSWDLIAVSDMPAQIDYVLKVTLQRNVHYVGHSQGTSVLFTLLASRPDYNSKIKTAQLLAPVAFMNNMKSPFMKVGQYLGNPSALTSLLGNFQFGPSTDFMHIMGQAACEEHALGIGNALCSNVLFLIVGGWDSPFLNRSIVPRVVGTHPDSSSAQQLLHYAQLYVSKRFAAYDFGSTLNLVNYGSFSAPDIAVKNIKAPITMYYADNDYFSSSIDVHRMAGLLPNVELVHLPPYNHMDYLFATNVVDWVNRPVMNVMSKYDGRRLV